MFDYVKIKPYSLQVKKMFQPLLDSNIRSGFIVEIKYKNYIGFGEIAPLPRYSIETMKEIPWLLEEFKSMKINIIDESEVDQVLQAFFEAVPSFKFGIETAIYDILSQIKKIPLAQMINPNCPYYILLNDLYFDSSQSLKSDVIKIKIRTNNIFYIKDLIEEVLRSNPKCKKVRLDFNGSLDLVRAIRICKEIEEYPIEYIEQPMNNPDLEDYIELKLHSNVSIAIDEHVHNIESAEKVIKSAIADFIIIKPTITGGIKASGKIIKLVQGAKMKVVITSAYESNIGLMACAHIASAYNISGHCGLNTSTLFTSDTSKKIIYDNCISIKGHGLGIKALI